MSEINDLEKEKEEIERKIKYKKMEDKKNRKNRKNSKANLLIRVSTDFNQDLETIIKERVKIRKDSKIISKPKLTSLIRKHKKWGEIRNDCINFNFEEE